jgi:uncharacterized membrane protein
MLRTASRYSRPALVAASAAVAAAAGVYGALRRTRKVSRMRLTASTTVLKDADDVYEFWHRLENLPTFMAHVDEVHTTGERSSHWRVTAPLGRTVEWDAETVDDVPGSRIAWRSREGADIRNEGSVELRAAPGLRGTEVHVTISYEMPAGELGQALARYFGEDPRQQLDDDLRRMKQVLETGEVVRSEGAPGGKRSRREFPQHPAQPLTPPELVREVRA